MKEVRFKKHPGMQQRGEVAIVTRGELDLSLYKVKRTPSAGNTLILNKGDGLEESLHWRAEIHRFPQMPVKYIIHRD